MARQRSWQEKYLNSKELNTELFYTVSPLTPMQEYFITWIRTYENVYETFHGGYYPILTERVIENDLFLDAYFMWLNNEKKSQAKKQSDLELKTKYQGDLKEVPSNMEVTLFKPKEE